MKTVAVLFGGQSGEHEVSIVSAQAVMAGLDPAKYNVLPIGITKEGRWIAGPTAPAALIAAADHALLPGGEPGTGSALPFDKLTNRAVEGNRESSSGQAVIVPHEELLVLGSGFSVLGQIDVVFPVLHGPMGEDGTVQGLLELAGLPYVGCGVAASAVGMDKALMKAVFTAAGLPVLPWLLVRRTDVQRDATAACMQIESRLSYPMFVKPANMGSSVGISKAKTRDELAGGLAEAARYDSRIVIEQGIPAREIEVSVLGNEAPEASVPGEVVPSGEWYDYEAKYLSGGSEIIIPAPIDAGLVAQVQELACKAFLSINGAGLARVDFLLNKETGELWLNEVNTMPGFTPVSMYAKMWQASGLGYGELLDRLVALAVERRRT
ncbi:MAG: D-alanine--D-alanine ligase [Chloroflexaceae bacterium]|jgi:D-alanine-D-alanine ligase|nr:D-alanine--D-alanine ligase [Chloroflexaceae bacterium]